jgi:hypothetical protein
MGRRLAGEQAHPGVLPRLGQGVTRFQPFPAAQTAARRADVVAQRRKIFVRRPCRVRHDSRELDLAS